VFSHAVKPREFREIIEKIGSLLEADVDARVLFDSREPSRTGDFFG